MQGNEEPLDETAARYSSQPKKVHLKKKQSQMITNPRMIQALRIPKSQITMNTELESSLVKQELRVSDQSNHNLHMVLGNQGLALSPELQRRQPLQTIQKSDFEQRLPPKQYIIRDNIRDMIRSNIRGSKRSSQDTNEDEQFSAKTDKRNITPSEYREARFGSVVQIGPESSLETNQRERGVILTNEDSIVFDTQFSPQQSPTGKIKKVQQNKYLESNFQIKPQLESNGQISQQYRKNIGSQNKQYESLATMTQTDPYSTFNLKLTKPPFVRKKSLVRPEVEQEGQAQQSQNQSFLNMTIATSSLNTSNLNLFNSQQVFPSHPKSRGCMINKSQHTSETPQNIQNQYNRELSTLTSIKGNGAGQQKIVNFEGLSSHAMRKFKESIDGNFNSIYQQSSVENWRQLYNPTKNTINLEKLSMALHYQSPQKNGDFPLEYHRRQSNAIDDSTLQDILNQTLQKLKRRPSKMTGRLVPIDRTCVAAGDVNQAPLNQQNKSTQELNLDEMTQEDKFYLIQQIESKIQKNVRYNQKNTVVFQDFSDEENEFAQEGECQSSLTQNKSTNPSVVANYNIKRVDSLEVIEDCAEDLEDEPFQHITIKQPIPSKKQQIQKKPFQRRFKQLVNEGQKQILTKADLVRYLRPQDHLESQQALKISCLNDPDSVQISQESFSAQNIMNDCNDQSPQGAVRNTFFQNGPTSE